MCKRISYKQAYKYIKSDCSRYRPNPTLTYILYCFLTNHCFRYLAVFRLAKTNSLLAKSALHVLSLLHNIQIPTCTEIGYGFYIGHGFAIVINGTAILGNNVNISQITTIGSNLNNAARIGNNVYIGPHSCILEDVIIGDNVTIGAGSIVISDAPDNSTMVGSPARVINYDNPGRFIMNKFNDNC